MKNLNSSQTTEIQLQFHKETGNDSNTHLNAYLWWLESKVYNLQKQLFNNAIIERKRLNEENISKVTLSKKVLLKLRKDIEDNIGPTIGPGASF